MCIRDSVSGSTPTNYWPHISERIEKAIEATRGVVQDVNEIDLPWSPVSGSNSGSIVP